MAKIPTILEAGRADGKLIKTDSIYDDNQEKFLSDKIKEIDNNHNELNDKVESLTDIVNNNELDIENKLEAEKTRATTAENNLRETIDNITEVNENATSANIVTIDNIPNTSSSNVQQALNELFKNSTFAGIATPTTNPGTPDGPVFYLATETGTYSNFNGISVADGEVAILEWKDGWTKKTTRLVTEQGIIYDVSARNDGAVFESLSALLSSSNLSTLIPTSVRHGGMTIKFIQGSVQNPDNKYVQYRLMTTSFSTNKSDWQGVDDEPTIGSDNLVKSGGTANKILELEGKTISVSGGVTSVTDSDLVIDGAFIAGQTNVSITNKSTNDGRFSLKLYKKDNYELIETKLIKAGNTEVISAILKSYYDKAVIINTNKVNCEITIQTTKITDVVNELNKSVNDGIFIQEDLPYTDEYLVNVGNIKVDGTLDDNTGYKASDILPIPERCVGFDASRLHINYGFVLYDSNDEVVYAGGKAYIDLSDYPTAKKFRFSIWHTAKGGIVTAKVNTFAKDKLQRDIDSITEDVDTLNENVYFENVVYSSENEHIFSSSTSRNNVLIPAELSYEKVKVTFKASQQLNTELYWQELTGYTNIVSPISLSYVKVGNMYVYEATIEASTPIKSNIFVQANSPSDCYSYMRVECIKSGSVNNIAEKVSYNKIVVGSGIDADYSTIKAAIDSINDSNEHNIYDVYVQEGEYDIVAELFPDGNFYETKGLDLPDYVNLIGIGRRENTILKAELPQDVTLEISTSLSTINFDKNNIVKNITFIAKNCRYACHDESANKNKNTNRTIENCSFIHKGVENNSLWQWCSGYGQGISSGTNVLFKNCYFETNASGGGGFINHNSANSLLPYSIDFESCKFVNKVGEIAFRYQSAGTPCESRITIKGCSFESSNELRNIECGSYSKLYKDCDVYLLGYGNKNAKWYANNCKDGESMTMI